MTDLQNIKEKILTDEKVATAVEYLMSKVILDKKLPTLWFIYKKHKVILGKNGLYSVYNPDGKKVANKIHFQEVAKYVIDNIKNQPLCDYCRNVESEMFRHKEKIEFFTNYNQRVKIATLDAKIDAMWDFYHRTKNQLLNILNYHNRCY